jgi:PPK2 family polyphosphate:nucleotide phosphotransferase
VDEPITQIKLDDIDHKDVESQDDYKDKLRDRQLRLLNLQRRLVESKRTLVLVFEGPDAGGKGGAIKRVVEKLDPRYVRVHSIIKPSEEELHHHYLWRFWIKAPAAGRIAVFDRSWYGRVLVERVESFATREQWKRAYREINEFERLLADDGAVILKFYLHITKQEQLDRFKKRQSTPEKRWKINEEDWRNREKWDEYNQAAEEMFGLTSTKAAPWNVIGANYKWYVRLRVLKLIIQQLEKAL